MILRELSPARAECLDDLSSIFEALQHGECALRPFLSLVGDLKKPVERVSSVGGIAGKLACSVGDEGILVVRRSVLPLASLGLNIIPVVGKAANQVLSGAYDLLGGGVETTGKKMDRCAFSGLAREVSEEGGLTLSPDELQEYGRPMVGCHLIGGRRRPATAVIRLGAVIHRPGMPKLNLSCEHTGAKVVNPGSSEFPQQWRPLGEAAFQHRAV